MSWNNSASINSQKNRGQGGLKWLVNGTTSHVQTRRNQLVTIQMCVHHLGGIDAYVANEAVETIRRQCFRFSIFTHGVSLT